MSTEDAPPAQPWKALIGRTLAVRGTSAGAGMCAALRRGFYTETQAYALPYVVPATTHSRQLQPLLYGAALTATHVRAPHTSSRRLGASLAALSARRSGAASVERRVLLLADLDLDAMAEMTDTLLAFCASERVPVNFYDLTSTLLAWGNGMTDASQAVRQRVLTDYYTPIRN